MNACAQCGSPTHLDFCGERCQHTWHSQRAGLDPYENNPVLHCAPDPAPAQPRPNPVTDAVRRLTPTTQQAFDAIAALSAAVRRTA